MIQKTILFKTEIKICSLYFIKRIKRGINYMCSCKSKRTLIRIFHIHKRTILFTIFVVMGMLLYYLFYATTLTIFLKPHLVYGYKKYQPTWDSLESRPLPPWYDEAKFGIFIHWGVFSVPSFGNEWFWNFWQGDKKKPYVNFMKQNYRPEWTYADFASQFTAEFFDPDQWAEMFQASGAKYVVLTSKHHEGFTNWPSKVSFNWNSMDVGPRRDLVGDLANSIRKKTDIRFGLYHSLYEWFNPLYLEDQANNYTTQRFIEYKVTPGLHEIVNNYKPEVIWSDGEWDANDTYWNSTHFLAWLYNESPVKDTVVVNDRWGSNVLCKRGGFLTCSDRYSPDYLVEHKWENCMTIDKKSWGYRREAMLSDYFTIEELVALLAKTVSCGGNLLMNVGPTHDGRIVPIYEERLRQMGQWLDVNGDAIYSTKPWIYQNDTVAPNVWYTCKRSQDITTVYAIVLDWPRNVLTLGAVRTSSTTTINLIGYPEAVNWKNSPSGGLDILLPSIHCHYMPCQWAWVFAMTGVSGK